MILKEFDLTDGQNYESKDRANIDACAVKTDEQSGNGVLVLVF